MCSGRPRLELPCWWLSPSLPSPGEIKSAAVVVEGEPSQHWQLRLLRYNSQFSLRHFLVCQPQPGSGRQWRPGQSPIISQSKCLGWKLWIVWLRSPACELRGRRREQSTSTQHYTALHNIPGTVVTLLPTISEQQSPNTIYSTTTTVLEFLFTIVCCAWQAQYFCHRPLNNSADALC